ncbi:Fe-S cluster assembly sulfur transfer protein SufU [Spiroplasma sp. BIUS-1]|uniref:Fe-S cluster assembly sulfur transfer protein SufU n=1 Tax=Spiroplasma sp. BIUS-1 TaxID=216964 RepID=UPI00139830FB|nr:SUF system NifU family Fe-S cluster assembly protein [Spiroplasma sp. BIUS-1]QHX36884.1 FeS assembly protein [Spiroplasma sp. BIUS-1]
MFDKDDKIQLRQIIMEHYTQPDFKGLIENDKSIIKFQDSPTCSDEINVQLLIENDQIIDARFDGNACAISTASTDIMCSKLKGLSVIEAQKQLVNYYNMIAGNEYDESILDELIAFWEINKQGNRINCALLGADGFKSILNKEV